MKIKYPPDAMHGNTNTLRRDKSATKIGQWERASTIEFTIPQFSVVHGDTKPVGVSKRGCGWISPQFTLCGEPWKLYLYPDGVHEDGLAPGYVAIFARYMGTQTRLSVSWGYKFCTPTGAAPETGALRSLVDAPDSRTCLYCPGEEDDCTESLVQNSSANGAGPASEWGYDKCCRLTDLVQDLLTNDTLVIVLSMGVYRAQKSQSTSAPPLSGHLAERRTEMCQVHLASYAELLNSETGADVTFVIEEEEEDGQSVKHFLKAHKAILNFRSRVFAAMFSPERFKEASAAEVPIGDTRFIVFRELIRFLYCGDVSSTDVFREFGLELWTLADKYDARALCELCDLRLAHSLSEENLAERISWCCTTTIDATTYLWDACCTLLSKRSDLLRHFLESQRSAGVTTMKRKRTTD